MHKETREFTFSEPPTGDDIVTKIWEHSLAGWNLDKIVQLEDIFSAGYSMGFKKYNYTVIFERIIRE